MFKSPDLALETRSEIGAASCRSPGHRQCSHAVVIATAILPHRPVPGTPRQPRLRGHPITCLFPVSFPDPAMTAFATSAKLVPILLLIGSNIFMTMAWYG